MKPNKSGQLVKYHTPFPDENPKQVYLLVELYQDVERPRGYMKPLFMSDFLSGKKSVFIDELEVFEVQNTGLVGQFVTIQKKDMCKIKGEVVKTFDPKLTLLLSEVENGAISNIYLTVKDNNGVEYEGFLIGN